MSPEASVEQPGPPATPPTTSSGPGRWVLRGFIGVALIAIVGSAVYFSADTLWAEPTSVGMTHRVSRGDLVVSVIEQGTLESSNNTEIKCNVRGFNTVTFVVPGGTVVKKGDVLVRLDTKVIEETVSLTYTNAHIAEATLERSRADVARAEIAVDAYLNGRYRSQMQSLEKELEVARSNLLTANKMLEQTRLLYKRGFVNKLEVQGNAFTVQQAELELKAKETEIRVLRDFTRKMELETLNGNLTASRSKLQADVAGLETEVSRRDRAEQELKDCVITAQRDGLVIYPSAAAWKDAPDITEGATVRKDQVLLLMPDLEQMQVKVGIHESIVDRVSPGLDARVTLPDRELDAGVTTVATVTQPAGWWTGNVVEYDTIIRLPNVEGLKPGMTAAVEVILARHSDVLTVPVSAVVESTTGDFCWVATPDGPERRELKLGDSNDVYVIAETGLTEGDDVVLNPTGFIEEAQKMSLKSFDAADMKPTDERASGAQAPEQSDAD